MPPAPSGGNAAGPRYDVAMSAPGRATATLAAVLILLGAATWALTPVALLMDRLDDVAAPALMIRAAALVLGCLVGGASAAAALPTVPRPIVIGAAALAAGVVLAMPGGAPPLTTQAALLGGAVLATAAGAWLGSRMWPGLGKVGAAAFMQLAVITTVVVGNGYLAHHHGTDPSPWLPMMLAMVAGGAVTARLVPTVTIGHIATSWLFIAAVTLGLAFVLASQRFFVLIAVLVAAFLVPFPIALSALGAALARRRGPPPADLPSATARG